MTFSRLRYVGCHRIDGFRYEFPHLCPGYGCAIQAWLITFHIRRLFEMVR